MNSYRLLQLVLPSVLLLSALAFGAHVEQKPNPGFTPPSEDS